MHSTFEPGQELMYYTEFLKLASARYIGPSFHFCTAAKAFPIEYMFKFSVDLAAAIYE